ncbi:MAG: metallophosphoesterase [Ruminococcus sp.]|nr:metallophosphoesterase [Ruminococcus sp.]
MSLFVIADLHLPLSVEKPMDIFSGWTDYVSRLEENWKRLVAPEDTVVIPGDVSWAMGISESYNDMRFINELPGTKILMKGNHDYWWDTVTKMKRFFDDNGFDTLKIVHNNCYQYEDIGICGSRGWINDTGCPADAKVIAREAMRLEASVSDAERQGLRPVVFLHYPPVYSGDVNEPIFEVLKRHGIKLCFYGHLHGRKAHQNAVIGEYNGVMLKLISADYLQFSPLNITNIVQNDEL